jgi:hypothetical protein
MTDPFTSEQRDELDRRQIDERELGHGNPPFTDAQVSELEDRAETRDQRRPRKSRFSITEQGELNKTANALRAEGVETAKMLEFNERQQKELTYRFRKRLFPFVAYILMIVAIVVSLIAIESRINANRTAIIHLCETTTHPSLNCTQLFHPTGETMMKSRD